MEHYTDALVIAAHPDDAEIGLGGTLAWLHTAGKRTAVIDLSDGEPTPLGSPEIRAAETAQATQILGISERLNLGLKNREISDTIEARKQLASEIRRLRPHTVFIPYWEDAHPDHVAAFNLATAACFYGKFVKSDLTSEPWKPMRILYYFGFHLRLQINPSAIIDVSAHMETKRRGLRAYHSQFTANVGNQQGLLDIEAENRYWGSRIFAEFGEPIFSREYPAVRSIGALFQM